ncbi:MAG: hypothetical protein JJU09_00455 [Rhodobacteraceae bacterium]|nr:hypothetical protein [Paracoccaceae bacterium]
MDEKIQITGLTRVAEPKPNKAGDTILAYFDCVVGPIELRGCALARRRKGWLTLWEPKLNDLRDKRGVLIADPEVKGLVVDAACGAFEALGGEL